MKMGPYCTEALHYPKSNAYRPSCIDAYGSLDVRESRV